MGAEQNWRTQIDAEDYLGFQNKSAQVADRRPVIRKASDLVGPGIAASAIRVTDWNDQLATYNGYFSGADSASNAPVNDEACIGFVMMDDLLGGQQVLTGLETGTTYTRVFLRNPSDPGSITWGLWAADERIPATARHNGTNTTSCASTVNTALNMPTLAVIGKAGTYQTSGTNLNILRQGVYTGYIRVVGSSGSTFTSITVQHPDAASFTSFTESGIPSPVWRPFTFETSVGTQAIKFSVTQSTGSTMTVSVTGFQITRIGDAV